MESCYPQVQSHPLNSSRHKAVILTAPCKGGLKKDEEMDTHRTCVSQCDPAASDYVKG